MKALAVSVGLGLLASGASAQAPAPPGALACSGCHGRGGEGSAFAPLAGQDAGAMAAALREFRSGQRPATVMDRIAKGFSDDEGEAIAAWLAAQR